MLVLERKDRIGLLVLERKDWLGLLVLERKDRIGLLIPDLNSCTKDEGLPIWACWSYRGKKRQDCRF